MQQNTFYYSRKEGQCSIENSAVRDLSNCMGGNRVGRRMVANFVCCISLLLASVPLRAENVVVTGQVGSTSISVTVSVSNVDPTKVKNPSDSVSLLNMLEIALGNVSGGGSGAQADVNPVLHTPNQPISGRNKYFYWDDSSDVSYTTNDDATYNLSYTATIVPNTDNGGDIAKVQDTGVKTVTVRVQFAGSSNWVTQTLSVLYAKPKAATTCSQPIGIHKGILLTCPTTVAPVTGTDGNTQAVSNYAMLVVDPAFTGTLDGKLVDNTAGNDTATTCTVNVNADTPNCVTCLGAGDAYLLTAQNQALVKAKSFTIASGMASFTGLDLDKTYTVIYQFENSTVPQCKQVTPMENFLVSDVQNSDDLPKAGDPRCFVVSATHGKYSSVADTYRWGRDHLLKPFRLGRLFVHWYYRTSEPFANYVSTAPVLRSMLYVALLVPAGGIFLLKNVMGLSAVELSILLLLLGSAGWLCLKQRKRRL